MEKISYQNYITNQISCTRVKGSICLVGARGLLSFDFGSEKELIFEFNRQRGADLTIIVNGSAHILNPNTPNKISIIARDIHISRASNAKGLIVLANVFENIEIQNQNEDVIVMRQTWDEFLKRSGKINGIRKTDNGVFANENAELNNPDILDVETDPPGCWIKKNGSIVFIHPCRVFGIKMIGEDSLPIANRSFDFLKQGNVSSNVNAVVLPTPPVLSAPPVLSTPPVLAPISPLVTTFKPTTEAIETSSREDHDYMININKSHLLNTKNSVDIPVSGMQSGKSYSFVIEGRRGNGNNKIGIKFVDLNNNTIRWNQIYIFKGMLNPIVSFADDCSRMKLVIYRPAQVSTGHLFIDKIQMLRPDDEKISFIPSEPEKYFQPLNTSFDIQNTKPVIANKEIKEVIQYLKKDKFKNEIEGNWFLPIPKLAHFYWGGCMPFLRYVSILSFVKQNPDWHVKLHIPKIFGTITPTWSTIEQSKSAQCQSKKNYIDLLNSVDLEIIKHDFTEYGFSNSAHEVHKSDFLRWILLANEGGVWCDFDILFHQPMCLMTDNKSENSDKNTGICRYNYNGSWANGSHAIGFLMSGGNQNAYYTNVMNLSKITFKAKKYQTIGADLLNSKFKSLIKSSPNCKFLDINPDAVYSITEIPKFISNKTYIQDYPNAIGFHWYGGHPSTSEIESQLNEHNFNQHNSFIAKLVQFIMG